MNITALEYLEAEMKAKRTGTHKIEFRRINEELNRLPKVAERLASEFLAMAWDELEKGLDPGLLAIHGIRLASRGRLQRTVEYKLWIAKITRKCFDLLENHQSGSLELTLTRGLTSLRLNDFEQFRLHVEELEQYCRGNESTRRCKLLEQAGESWEERRNRFKQLGPGSRMRQAGSEWRGRTDLN